jgi:hypothetical protein
MSGKVFAELITFPDIFICNNKEVKHEENICRTESIPAGTPVRAGQ